MDFRQLQYFVAVAEDLHFGRAATRLGITQPALSKQIAGLEKTLGVQLLFRTKRSVEITDAGRIFLDQAHQLLTQRDKALQITRRTGTGEIGHVSIGFTTTATQTILPPLLHEFVTRYPRVELEMIELPTEAQVSALNQNEIDIAFLHPPIDQRGLKVHPILKENFMAVLPPDHHLNRYERIPIEAFAKEPLIIHPRHEGPILYDGFLEICSFIGFQPNIIKESISLRTRLCLVAAGLGITFVSDRYEFLVGNNVICRPIDNCPIQLEFGAAWRENTTNQGLLNLLSILRQKVSKEKSLV